MALQPINEAHALQIQAGTLGRKAGHEFEDSITAAINSISYPYDVPSLEGHHLYKGNPAVSLLNYVAWNKGFKKIGKALAISTGALATSEEGKKWLSINGASVSRCKSDLMITIFDDTGKSQTIGVSTKQCNNRTPTNAQLYFTTAKGFVTLLRNNGLAVSDEALLSLRQFCGDSGYRPLDNPQLAATRLVDPRRFFWEETNDDGKQEWETLFSTQQDSISRLLFQKAYIEDPFVPDFLIHKTRKANSYLETEVAIYSVDELIELSRRYQGFVKRPYSVRKGSYKDPAGITHEAPRFGVIQMQRGGQQQHPEQLQFNLEAGYFYKLEKLVSEENS